MAFLAASRCHFCQASLAALSRPGTGAYKTPGEAGLSSLIGLLLHRFVAGRSQPATGGELGCGLNPSQAGFELPPRPASMVAHELWIGRSASSCPERG